MSIQQSPWNYIVVLAVVFAPVWIALPFWLHDWYRNRNPLPPEPDNPATDVDRWGAY